MDKFIVMTMIRKSGRYKTVKVVATKTLLKRKEPATKQTQSN